MLFLFELGYFASRLKMRSEEVMKKRKKEKKNQRNKKFQFAWNYTGSSLRSSVTSLILEKDK